MVREPVTPEQLRNAAIPTERTDEGIISEPFKPEQPSKALFPIVVIVGSRVI
jgi:hypothetical protein